MITVLSNDDITYVENILLDENNELKILSYTDLADIPQQHISLFCHKYGIYNLPTLELVNFLENEISGLKDKTIEIGAGNGVLSKKLDIIATDSYMQNNSIIQSIYNIAQQPPVKYGKNVMRYDALTALKMYKPKIVIGCWVTHLYNPNEHFRGGNSFGIDENKIINNVRKYIFIGNEHTHKLKPILSKPHKRIKEKWLLSRSLNKDENVIYIWEK